MHRRAFTLRSPVNALDILLRQCYTTPQCQKPPARRRYATATKEPLFANEVTDVAVLGGGITGLASAYFLTQRLPDAKITLFESTARLGGWLHSKQFDVGNGKVLFEQGPRNLRPNMPNGLVTLNLVHELGLEDQILMTSQSSVAAQNRFVYYPDHLVRMPGPGSSTLATFYALATEPVFNGLFLGITRELFKPKRPDDLEDESVGSFLSRRFGSSVADNIVSAVLHGIYAGDVYQLSVRTLMPLLWNIEKEYQSVVKGSIIRGLSGTQPVAERDIELIKSFASQPAATEKMQAVRKSSVFTFKNGIGELADRLEASLRENPNVEIRMQTLIEELNIIPDDDLPAVKLSTSTAAASDSVQPNRYIAKHVISTISGKSLAKIVRPSNSLSILSQTPSVTVMVVNLFYSNPSLLPVHGFGYLIPRSIPFTENPELALGVVFDTDAAIGQDDIPGTKVTVMMGGHWWDGMDIYPDEDEGASMAKAILKRHLGITELPSAIRVGLQKDCIPQYTVGHDQRMWEASQMLERFQGKLMVAGNSYTGVGLNDCVRAAKDVVEAFVKGEVRTGLESFVGGRKISWVKPTDLM